MNLSTCGLFWESPMCPPSVSLCVPPVEGEARTAAEMRHGLQQTKCGVVRPLHGYVTIKKDQCLTLGFQRKVWASYHVQPRVSDINLVISLEYKAHHSSFRKPTDCFLSRKPQVLLLETTVCSELCLLLLSPEYWVLVLSSTFKWGSKEKQIQLLLAWPLSSQASQWLNAGCQGRLSTSVVPLLVPAALVWNTDTYSVATSKALILYL